MRYLLILILATNLQGQTMLSGVVSSAGAASAPAVDNPTDTPSGGGCTGSSPSWQCTSTTSVTLAVASPASSVICYTIDGFTPAAGSVGACDSDGHTTTYSGAISVAANTTIKAIGTKAAYVNSGLLTTVYTIAAGCGSPVSGWTERSIADTVTNVYSTYGPPPTGHPVSTGNVEAWDNPNSLDMLWVYQTAKPVWTANAIGTSGAITMDGTTNKSMYLWNEGVSAIHTLTDVTTASAFTAFTGFSILGNCSNTNPTTTPYLNSPLIVDDGGFWGITCSTNGGTTSINTYVYDGAYKVIQTTVTQSTGHWIMFTLNGGTLSASVDGGTPATLSSGNILLSTGNVHIGQWSSSAVYPNAHLGEFIIYNTALSGGNITTNNTYGTCMWQH